MNLSVDFLVDGALRLLFLLHGQQIHQRLDGHALRRAPSKRIFSLFH